MNKPFTREPRYYVVKMRDAGAALTQAEAAIFKTIYAKVEQWRISHGKTRLQGVMVEYDWPEFEPVWKMIEQRTTGADTTPTPVPLVFPEIDYQAACVHEWANVEPLAKNPVRLACGLCGKLELMEIAT